MTIIEAVWNAVLFIALMVGGVGTIALFVWSVMERPAIAGVLVGLGCIVGMTFAFYNGVGPW